ncbi:EAL domain-containing protein [Luteimonas aquatica]|uniref:EAL domain-containing protein n=1 Tax=Luteimonas aquatica TaxID=450364 RepID=UPI001F590153|nr:EAL domain-containing protein [Luteimonas aquatica]
MHATPTTAAAEAERTPAARAEFPPPRYWHRWGAGDAPPAQLPAADAPAGAAEPGPPPSLLAPPAPGADEEAPYRVLLIEDDRSQALFAQSILNGAGMDVRVVGSGTEILSALREFRPELVLTDLHMPGTNGIEITAAVRADPAFSQMPVVILTGDTDPDQQLEVLQAGADDVLSKPVRPRHLIVAVASRVRRARAWQRQRDGEGLHPHTGLHTRPAMLQRLDAAVHARARGALYFVEIEGVATLRDRFGYFALEAALIEAGRALAAIADGQPIARLNENAFLLLGDDAGAAAQLDRARALRDGLGRRDIALAGETVRLRALVGYTPLPHEYEDGSSALAGAEQALREARALPAGIAAHLPAPRARETDSAGHRLLQEALAHDRFELAYQPIIAVAGGGEAQFQTLLRLRDDSGRLHTAGEILPLAEAAGALHEIDRRVMQHAVAVLRRRGREQRPVRLFVSQSARSLGRDGYADWLTALVHEEGIDSGSLVLDVRLEDALIHTIALQEFCAAMVIAGVQLCIGQYRAGADADALLARLPLSFVRLSARYSSQLDEPPVRDEMRTAIEYAHRLGLQVIGQQVENPQSAATLWVSGVDYIQGNLVQQAADSLDFDFQHSIL